MIRPEESALVDYRATQKPKPGGIGARLLWFGRLCEVIFSWTRWNKNIRPRWIGAKRRNGALAKEISWLRITSVG
jgi:hypothetical protein